MQSKIAVNPAQKFSIPVLMSVFFFYSDTLFCLYSVRLSKQCDLFDWKSNMILLFYYVGFWLSYIERHLYHGVILNKLPSFCVFFLCSSSVIFYKIFSSLTRVNCKNTCHNRPPSIWFTNYARQICLLSNITLMAKLDLCI